MTETDYNIFTTIASMTQDELLKTMYAFLQKTYGKRKLTATKSYIIAEGSIPIVLVAHMDTVFPAPPKEFYYDSKKEALWSPQGLGADDRAGVFAIMKIVQDGYRPHVILTTDEERGGIGASILAKVYRKPPFEMKYMIELDRQGACDCVFYECANNAFEKYINDFGYITAWGTFSDISVFGPEWKVAAVNLSIGYVREHSTSETLFVNAMYSTIDKVKKMLDKADEADAYEYIPDPYGGYMWPYAYAYGGWDFGPEDDLPCSSFSRASRKVKCHKCKKEYEENDCIPVMSKENPLYDHLYCFNCITDEGVGWCHNCGDAFEKSYPEQIICDICQKE